MSVYKCHAFIFLDQPPPWPSRTIYMKRKAYKNFHQSYKAMEVCICIFLWRLCYQHHSHHVSLAQWTSRLLTVTRELGSNPKGVLMWNGVSPVSVVSLHWWPRCDSDHWLRRPSVGASLGSAPTMCKPVASLPFSGCFTRLHSDNV